MSKNTLYKIMQAAFWMIYGSCYGYISYYLVARGFGTSVVGVVSATAGVTSAVMQPFVGTLADKPGLGWKKPLLAILSALIVVGGVMCVLTTMQAGALICIFYGLAMLLLGIAVPLINTAGVSFSEDINFGSARAVGSLGYAAISYTLGLFTAKNGPMIVPIAITVISIILLLVSMAMPQKPIEEQGKSAQHADASTAAKGFLRTYPAFTMLWVGCIFMLTVHMLSNSFLLQILEKAGGDSHSLGIAAAIGAIVEIPMIFCYERVNRYISAQNLFVLAACTYMLRSILQLLTGNLMVLYAIQFLQLTSWGIYASASVYYTKELIPAKDQNKGQAYIAGSLTIGTVISSLVGGQLIELYDVNVMLIFQNIMAVIATVIMVTWKMRYRNAKYI